MMVKLCDVVSAIAPHVGRNMQVEISTDAEGGYDVLVRKDGGGVCMVQRVVSGSSVGYRFDWRAKSGECSGLYTTLAKMF